MRSSRVGRRSLLSRCAGQVVVTMTCEVMPGAHPSSISRPPTGHPCVATVHRMDRERRAALVDPYYLGMMQLNGLDADEPLLRSVAASGRTTSSDEVVALLRDAWRERVMGAWFALFHDERDVGEALASSLETATGSLTAPPLAVAAVRRAGYRSVRPPRSVCRRGRRSCLGSLRVRGRGAGAPGIGHNGLPADRRRSTGLRRAARGRPLADLDAVAVTSVRPPPHRTVVVARRRRAPRVVA